MLESGSDFDDVHVLAKSFNINTFVPGISKAKNFDEKSRIGMCTFHFL